MKADFIVTVDINTDWVDHLARHRGQAAVDVVRESVALLEGRIVDGLRHHDAVAGPVSITTAIDGERFHWKP